MIIDKCIPALLPLFKMGRNIFIPPKHIQIIIIEGSGGIILVPESIQCSLRCPSILSHCGKNWLRCDLNGFKFGFTYCNFPIFPILCTFSYILLSKILIDFYRSRYFNLCSLFYWNQYVYISLSGVLKSEFSIFIFFKMLKGMCYGMWLNVFSCIYEL